MAQIETTFYCLLLMACVWFWDVAPPLGVVFTIPGAWAVGCLYFTVKETLWPE